MKNNHWCRRTCSAVLIAAVLGTAAHTAASAAPNNDEPAADSQARLAETASRMPAGWPATEVMRRGAEAPTATVDELTRWQQDVAAMPAGWPATEVMGRALDAATTTATADNVPRWQQDVAAMPAGWPATEVMRRALGAR